jgi:hypothetical protein
MSTAQLVLNNLNVVEVLQDFHKYPVTATNNGLVTTCPACNGRQHVSNSYMLCENKLCSFRVGRAIDFMAFIFNGYEAAVKSAMTTYPSRFQTSSYESIRNTGISLLLQRRVINFIRDYVRTPSGIPRIGIIQTAGWLNNLGINVTVQPSSALILERDEALNLFNLIKQAYPDEKIVLKEVLPNQNPIIFIPYFGNPAELAGFAVLPFHQPDKAVLIKLGQYKFGFTGLWDMHPESYAVKLHTNFADCLRENTLASKFKREDFHITFFHDIKGAATGWLPKSVELTAEVFNPAHLAALAELSQQTKITVKVDDTAAGVEPLNWYDFARTTLLQAMEADKGVSPKVELLLHSLKLPSEEASQLITELNYRGHLIWAAQIQKLQQIKMLDITSGPKGVEFYQQGEGYYVERANGARVDLTNFTLDINRTVQFIDSSRLCHSGHLYFDGKKHGIVLDGSSFNSISTLEENVRRAEFALANETSSSALPTIMERNLSKELLTHFRKVTSNLQRVEGLDGLGWNTRKTGFYTPWGKIIDDSIKSEVVIPNPEFDYWNCYDLGVKPLPILEVQTQIPVSLAALISQCIGLITRSYMDFPIKPVHYSYAPETITILRNVFRALGQREAWSFIFRENAGSDIRGLRGFPMLVTGANPSQLDKLKLPLIALTDSGPNFYDQITEKDLNNILPSIPYIVQKSVQYLLRTKGESVKMFNSVNAANALAKEGAYIISEACQIKWREPQPVNAAIEDLLNQIPFNKVVDHFSHNLSEQKIKIDLRGLNAVNYDDLQMELIKDAKHLLFKDGVCEIDSFTMLYLLKQFYGEIPQMRQEGLASIAQFS